MSDFLSMISNVLQGVLGQQPEGAAKSEDINLENARKRLQSIDDSSYAAFQQDRQGFLGKPGAIWFVRKDLEAARFYLTGGSEGYGNQERIQAGGLQITNPSYWEVKAYLELVEMKVREMEAAKGYEFVAVRDNTILFKELKTGTVLSPDASTEI